MQIVTSSIPCNSISLVPLAACVGMLAQSGSNHIVRKSIQFRLGKLEKTNLSSEAILAILSKTQDALEDEIKSKRSAFWLSVPVAIALILVTQISVWIRPSNQVGEWFIHSPTIFTLGIDYAFHAFFNALDNIQDEVSLLGKARTFDIITLLLLTTSAVVYLVNANRLYFLKATTTLFGCVVAKTSDTIVWRGLGITTLLTILLSMMVSGRLANAPGPSWPVVIFLSGVFCAVNSIYEFLTAGKRTDASTVPPWLEKAASAGLIHYVSLAALTLHGIYPVSWVLREIFGTLLYYRLKISQHAMNLCLVKGNHQDKTRVSSSMHS